MSSFAPPEADSAQTPVYGQEPEPEPELDGDGYRSLTLKQHVGRLLSVVVFVIMFPFVVVALGSYRLLSLVKGALGTKQE